ncbi:MAG: hypothetical protein ACYSSL_08565 [Planctomycetota bacterium]|jgi:cytochrome b subunit of formate dehydrogenase
MAEGKKRIDWLALFTKFLYVAALLTFLLLAVTGFNAFFITHTSLSGYFLMVHTIAGAVFAVCLALLSLMCSGNNRLNTGREGIARRICFWLLMVLALPLIFSLVLAMLHFCPAETQEPLLLWHSYAAVLFTLVAIVHFYLMILSWAGKYRNSIR